MYRKKAIKLLIVLMIMFVLVFMLSLWHLHNGSTVFDLGLPSHFENYLVMLLSAVCIAYIVYEIIKIEHRKI